jgi:hypothetical protein
MDKLADWEESLSILDACLRPIAQRPVDISDPEWFTKLSGGPHPLDEAGVRPEAESLLMEVIESYLNRDDATRQAIRELFAKNRSFSWAANLPFPPTTAEDFRSHLILLSIKDQGIDTRDTILWLQDLCKRASSAGVDTEPVLREIALLSSNEDKYRMGSTRSLLLRQAEQMNSPDTKDRHG